MARKGKRHKHAPHRSATRKHTDRPLRPVEAPSAEDEMLSTMRTAIRSDDPTALVTLVSSLLSVSDAWAPAHHDDLGERVPLDALVESFLGTPYAETTAALHVIAALLPDELDAARVRRALADRRHPVPDAVVGLRDITVDRAAKIGDDLADGDNIILGLTWPGIGGVTAVIYVDEAFGTRIKDVFLVPEAFDVVWDRYGEVLADHGGRTSALAEVAPRDARAGLQQALDIGDAPDAIQPPDDWSGIDGDPLGWPGARPFVEMLLRRMPPGGTSVLTSSALPRVSVIDAVDDFLGAPEARGLDDGDELTEAVARVADDAMEHAGHPLRWSPVQAELALTQRLPWAPEATDAVLDAVALVLPAYIRFAHRRLAVSAEATRETLAAVEEWMPAFDALRAAAPVARWREVGAMIDAFEHGDHGPLLRQALADAVGGAAVLASLDADPLPHEPLDLDEVAADVRDTASEIAALVDEWFTTSPRVAHLGSVREEWRTAAHRLLVGATQRDPGWLRRRASASGRACGLIWATGVANHLVGPHSAVLVKDLAADFGVSGPPSQKADTLLRAWAGGRWLGSGDLGDAGLLVSTRRAQIIAERDAWGG